jgi:hypothetical protein
MTDNFIQLKKDNILRLGIRDAEGNDTGEQLEFDLEDVSLLLKYQDFIEKHKKNITNLENAIKVINKRPDVKGKKLLTKNQEDTNKAVIDFYNKEIETYNIFLGENGVQKLLNGRCVNWSTFADIDEIIDKQILPKMDLSMDNAIDEIVKKYAPEKSDVEEIK